MSKRFRDQAGDGVRCSLTSLKEKLIKTGAKVVNHDSHVAFQMDEVVISENLFADIVREVDWGFAATTHRLDRVRRSGVALSITNHGRDAS